MLPKLRLDPPISKQGLDRQSLGSIEAASGATQPRRHSSLGSFLVCAYSHVAGAWAVPMLEPYAHRLCLDHMDVGPEIVPGFSCIAITGV